MTAADLAGKSVAVQVGTTYLENVRKVPGVGDIKTFPKDTDAQAALMSGRVDAWVGDKFTGIDLVKAQKGKVKQGDLLFKESIAMAVKKGNSSLLKELNSALEKALNNGTYAKISNQYFGQTSAAATERLRFLNNWAAVPAGAAALCCTAGRPLSFSVHWFQPQPWGDVSMSTAL